jgi:DNA-binding NarL/FixJ family response regulator
VRPPEVVAACEWVCARLRNPDVLLQGSDVLALDDLDAGNADGARLIEEARRLLQIQGKPDSATLTLADIADRGELLSAMRFNGDGVITPATTQDDAVRATVAEIMRTHGSVPDRHKDKRRAWTAPASKRFSPRCRPRATGTPRRTRTTAR